MDDSATMRDIALHEKMQAVMAAMITELAKSATGSASRVARAVVLTEPPNIDKGEITDKGSINQRAVLKERAELVSSLYADTALNILKP
jgi:feruloyl-CoA synthase